MRPLWERKVVGSTPTSPTKQSRDDPKLALVSESLRGAARSQDDLKLDLVGVTVEESSLIELQLRVPSPE